MLNHTNPNIRYVRLLFLVVFLAALALPLGPAAPAQAQSSNGLVGYWPFDEGSGTTSADRSGSGNTATLHSASGFTSITAPTDFANPAALASVNSAASYATAPGNNIDNLQQFTIAFWVRFNSASPNPAVTLVALGNGKASFYTLLPSSTNLFFSVTVDGGERAIDFAPSLFNVRLTDGLYHHVAGSYDGANMRMYFDGVFIDTLHVVGTMPAGNGVLLSSPSEPLDGALDDVRIYNRALSDGEVADLATFGCGQNGEQERQRPHRERPDARRELFVCRAHIHP